VEFWNELHTSQLLCTSAFWTICVECGVISFFVAHHCYLCSLLTEALHLNEHEAAKWLAKEELDSVKWLPADLEVVEKI
jgi:8-oxo-dGTP diphosphatase